MATVQAGAKRNVMKLLADVRQLSSAQFHEFEQGFAVLRAQNGKGDDGSASEETLLASIRHNSTLPAAQQRRFDRLRRKRQVERIIRSEERAARIVAAGGADERRALRALTELARRRGCDLKSLMRDLGLSENRNVF